MTVFQLAHGDNKVNNAVYPDRLFTQQKKKKNHHILVNIGLGNGLAPARTQYV